MDITIARNDPNWCAGTFKPNVIDGTDIGAGPDGGPRIIATHALALAAPVQCDRDDRRICRAWDAAVERSSHCP
jgi:hypothetical protein